LGKNVKDVTNTVTSKRNFRCRISWGRS